MQEEFTRNEAPPPLPPSLSLSKRRFPARFLLVPLFLFVISPQVPAYIASYDEFAAKGVKEIFVIAVNDTL